LALLPQPISGAAGHLNATLKRLTRSGCNPVMSAAVAKTAEAKPPIAMKGSFVLMFVIQFRMENF
jgi:hypothetical protein